METESLHYYTQHTQKGTTMSNTPYEMRFNYYMAASDQLQSDYHAKFNEAVIRKEDGFKGVYPAYPTADEIFALAEAIKAFAEKK